LISRFICAYPHIMNHHAILLALLSAVLFGISTPAAKALLGAVDPTVLAGLLYSGAGLGVAALRRVALPLSKSTGTTQAPLTRADAPWLAGASPPAGLSAQCC
jgi:drug/metabolite transporter (DMT)-like permease